MRFEDITYKKQAQRFANAEGKKLNNIKTNRIIWEF